MTKLSTGAELAAVADGMGGYAGGEVASRRTLEVLRASLEEGSDLTEAVRAANAAVYEEASRSRTHRGMGTTLVALLRNGMEYQLVNVGDSRAYRVDAAGIQQLTRDHSFVAEAIRTGQLTPEDAAKSRWRNAVTRAVGTQADLEVDRYGPFAVAEPHTLVLCTDGLYRVVPDADLRQLIAETTTPGDAVRRLAAAALRRGSDDNITVVVLRFGPEATADEPVPVRAQALPAQPVAERVAPDRKLEWHLHGRTVSVRWTLLEIVIIFLGIIVLGYAVLRMLAS